MQRAIATSKYFNSIACANHPTLSVRIMTHEYMTKYLSESLVMMSISSSLRMIRAFNIQFIERNWLNGFSN